MHLVKFILSAFVVLFAAKKDRRKVNAPVHFGGYSDGKHIQLTCDRTWVEPKWGSPDEQRTEDKDVYVADDDRLYTFVEEKVSCEGCKL